MIWGRRLFFWGSLLLALVGVGHIFGQVSSRAESAAIASVMKSHHPPGAAFSQWDLFETFSFGFGFLILWIGLSGMLFTGTFAAESNTLRTAALLYAIAPAGLSAMAAAYGLFAAIAIMSPSLILYVAAFLAAPRHH